MRPNLGIILVLCNATLEHRADCIDAAIGDDENNCQDVERDFGLGYQAIAVVDCKYQSKLKRQKNGAQNQCSPKETSFLQIFEISISY